MSSNSTPSDPMRIAVLISGSGRTLKNFIDLAAEKKLPVDIRLVISSSSKAGRPGSRRSSKHSDPSIAA